MRTTMRANDFADRNGQLQRSMQDLVWDNASQMLTDVRDRFRSPDYAPSGLQQPLASQL